MDVAALIIAIVALILALVVSGFGILLQWLMFKANTDQVARMGEQNAALGERLGSTLTEIREITAHTRGTLDTTMRDVIGAALPRLFPSEETEPDTGKETTPAPRPGEESVLTSWRHRRLIGLVKGWPQLRIILPLLGSKAEGVAIDDVLDAVPVVDSDTGKEIGPVSQLGMGMYMLGSLGSLGLIRLQGNKLQLNPDVDVDSILAETDQA